MATFRERVKSAWNAFATQGSLEELNHQPYGGFVPSYGARPDKVRPLITNERSIIASIMTKLSVDVSEISIRHIRADANGRYVEDIDSALNGCLTVEANIDQAARAFRQDIAMTLFEKGVVAIVPVDTTSNPNLTTGFDIQSMRVGEVVQWYPKHVKLSVYNERNGKREEVILHKSFVAIIENPLYRVMNEPNSTLQRLLRKLSMLDSVDEMTSSGKLDLIIQLPYVIKSEARREQAEQRRKDIEFQLKGSKYGIAYTDGTEKITQLNRPVENNLLKQVEFLTAQLYSQLGITEEIMNGTANEATMLNYFNRTVKPVMDAIVEGMRRNFLSKTARSQHQTIMYFRDAFSLVPVAELAEIGDKFTRNEILTANEIRQMIGIKPADDPKADELRNSNMPEVTKEVAAPASETNTEGDGQNGS